MKKLISVLTMIFVFGAVVGLHAVSQERDIITQIMFFMWKNAFWKNKKEENQKTII